MRSFTYESQLAVTALAMVQERSAPDPDKEAVEVAVYAAVKIMQHFTPELNERAALRVLGTLVLQLGGVTVSEPPKEQADGASQNA